MTCKDCIHYPVCSMPNNLEYICEQSIRDDCEHFMRADNTVEVVRCKDCKYLEIINSREIYAKCKATGLEFKPFDIDTREHYCSYGERREQNEE